MVHGAVDALLCCVGSEVSIDWPLGEVQHVRWWLKLDFPRAHSPADVLQVIDDCVVTGPCGPNVAVDALVQQFELSLQVSEVDGVDGVGFGNIDPQFVELFGEPPSLLVLPANVGMLASYCLDEVGNLVVRLLVCLAWRHDEGITTPLVI